MIEWHDALLLQQQINNLIHDEPDWLAASSNLCAFLFETMPQLNWVGFYYIKQDTLVVGPFQGKVACARLEKPNGVCWHSVLQQRPVIVDDVHQFPGHIACDSASKSELVIPLIKNGHILGVLDLDSPHYKTFTTDDIAFLQPIISRLATKLPDTF